MHRWLLAVDGRKEVSPQAERIELFSPDDGFGQRPPSAIHSRTVESSHGPDRTGNERRR